MTPSHNPDSVSVLIADDCPVTRRLLTLFLKKHGHQVACTENGEECLNAALQGSYDLVITDLDMPKMNGLECATRIREVKADLPIIAITASFPDIVREQCFKVGINGFMTKPLNFPELNRRLKEVAAEKAVTHPVL